MKTLTTLAAVAALIAGVSIASAQMSPPSGAPSGSSGTMGAGSSSSGTSQQQAIGKGRYCLEAAGGTLNCKYASLAAGQKDAKTSAQTCAPNPNSATTGQKQQ